MKTAELNRFLTIPDRSFDIIYADPPWKYNNSRTRAAAAKEYDVLTIADLTLLPVGLKCKKDATLFLWTTSPFLPKAIALGQEWGFEYKTIGFLWAKRNKKSNTPFFGLGNWSRSNVEACLLFTKGAPKREGKDVPQFLWHPILRHSEKPGVIRQRIVRLMGDKPRLEMFSRHNVPGWQSWGNQLLA